MKSKKRILLSGGAIILLTLVYALKGTGQPAGYADSDELITAAYQQSVAHPPGFPLLVFIGFIAMRLFSGVNPALVANILAGFFEAVAVVIFFHLIKRLLDYIDPHSTGSLRTLSAFGAAGFLAFSYLWWMYATIFEMVSLTNLLTILTLFFAFHWYTAKTVNINRYFWATWISAGILLGHYQLGGVLLPGLLVMVLHKFLTNKCPTMRSALLIGAGLALFVTVFVGANLPLFIQNHSAALYSWSFIPSLSGWWGHLTRQDYVGNNLELNSAYGTAFPLPTRFDLTMLQSIGQFLVLLASHFTLIIMLIAGVGMLTLRRLHRPTVLIIITMFLVSGPLLAGYLNIAAAAFEPALILGIAERQLMIGEITLILLAAVGLHYILKQVKFVPPVLVVGMLLLIELGSNRSVILASFSRTLASQIAAARLNQAASNALIICTNDLDCYSLFYAKVINRLRPDITVLTHIGVYEQRYLDTHPEIYPYQDRENPDYLAQLIAWNRAKRPVYLTSGVGFYPDYIGLEQGPFYLQPEGLLLRIVSTYPDVQSPADLPGFLVPKTHADARDNYGQGILEIMANNEAYAGYLSLLYQNSNAAALYLNRALSLDPKNAQAAELLQNLTQFSQELAVPSASSSAADLIDQAKSAQSTGEVDTAEALLRRASYLEPVNPDVLDQLITFYQKINDSQKANRIIGHKRLLK